MRLTRAWIPWVTLVLLVVIVAPAQAGAARQETVRGNLVADGQLVFRGTTSIRPDEGSIDLRPELVPRDRLAIRWDHATGYTYSVRSEKVAGSFFVSRPLVTNETFEWGPGWVDRLACTTTTECVLVSNFDDRARVYQNGSFEQAGIEPEQDQATTSGHPNPAIVQGGMPLDFPGWLTSGPGNTSLRASNTTLVVNGQFDIWLTGIEGVAHHDAERTIIKTGVTESEPVPTGGLVSDRERTWMIVHLEGAHLVVPPGSRSTVYFPTGAMDFAGEITSLEGKGWVQARDANHSLSNDPVSLTGRFDASLDAPPSNVTDARYPPRNFRFVGPSSSATVDGSSILGSGSDAISLPQATTLAVAVAAIVAVGSRLLWAPLYSRLKSADLVRNASRRRIIELLRSSGPRPVMELSRELAMSPRLVTYHVTLLAKRKIVSIVRVGRFKFVHEVGPDPSGGALKLMSIRRHPLKSRIADALVASRQGSTQSDLASSTGASQRLISHHLERLVASGFAYADRGRPARYHATDELRRGCAASDLSSVAHKTLPQRGRDPEPEVSMDGSARAGT